MKAFQLNLVTPERELFNTSATILIAPGTEGYLGVQHGHIPMAVELKTGLIYYRDASNGLKYYIWLAGGILEISPDGVHIIADEALKPDEIDIAQTKKALDEVKKVLQGKPSNMTTTEALVELEEASTRLKLAKMHHKHHS